MLRLRSCCSCAGDLVRFGLEVGASRLMSKIPIMRPKLPVTERLVGYLHRIDQSQFYSNFGPLALALEDRLAEHYGLGTGTVTTVANATLGLALTLTALGAKPGSLC